MYYHFLPLVGTPGETKSFALESERGTSGLQGLKERGLAERPCERW